MFYSCFFLMISFKKFYSSIVALQCCISFCCPAKWISHIISPLFLDFLPIQVTTEHWVEFPVLSGRFSAVICAVYRSVVVAVTSADLVTKSCLTLATPWTVALQAPLSVGLSRQEYWSGLPFAPPGDLPDPGIESRSATLQADSLPTEPPGKPHMHMRHIDILPAKKWITSNW